MKNKRKEEGEEEGKKEKEEERHYEPRSQKCLNLLSTRVKKVSN